MCDYAVTYRVTVAWPLAGGGTVGDAQEATLGLGEKAPLVFSVPVDGEVVGPSRVRPTVA